jgi:hypothetical protein
MPIESDAQGDLELAPDDAESVAGGKRSLEGVESHA